MINPTAACLSRCRSTTGWSFDHSCSGVAREGEVPILKCECSFFCVVNVMKQLSQCWKFDPSLRGQYFAEKITKILKKFTLDWNVIFEVVGTVGLVVDKGLSMKIFWCLIAHVRSLMCYHLLGEIYSPLQRGIRIFLRIFSDFIFSHKWFYFLTQLILFSHIAGVIFSRFWYYIPTLILYSV